MMSDKSELPARRRLFQFTLGDLLVAMLGICVGLSVGRSGVKLPGMVLVAVMVWFVVGICSQIRDLWSTFHGRDGLSHDQRWGWRFAVFWRIGVVCLLLGYHVVAQLLNCKLLSLPDGEVNSLVFGYTLRGSVSFLCLVIIMSATPGPQDRRRRTRWSTVMEACGILAGMFLAILVSTDGMCIAVMAEISIRGILAAQPLRFFDADAAAYLADRSSFFWLSLFAAALSPFAFVSLRRLSQAWAFTRQRWLWGGLVLLAISLSAAYSLWLAAIGFESISPYLARAMPIWPLHYWIGAIVLFLVAVTALAYRIVVRPETPATSELCWRKHPHTYYHERGPVLACLAIALTLSLVGYARLYHVIFLDWYEMLHDPSNFLVEAAILLAMRGVILRFRCSASSVPTGIPELPLAAFCTVWIATFLLAIPTLVTLAGLGFAAWLSQWYVNCWP